MKTLIITRSNDNESVDMVAKACAERGAPAFRFDTDRFPTEARASIRLADGASSVVLADHGERVEFDELAGAWHRRLEIGAGIPTTLAAEVRKASVEEARRVVNGLLASLPCFVLDPLQLLRQAEHKQLQLDVARRAGLDVPRTLVTNDAEAARAFFDECRGRMITKMITETPSSVGKMSRTRPRR